MITDVGLAPNPKEESSTIGIEDFKKIDLRVAKVLSAERIKKSEKLLKLRVALGNEERQIVAGIAQHCKPEELVGRLVIVVANLEPIQLMGEESRGMLLAAHDGQGKLSLASCAEDIPSGSVVK
jgi:methionyl-tRNA synthetase